MNRLITDIHTHTVAPAPGRIINLDPTDADGFSFLPGQPYSAGIHPWNTPSADNILLSRLDILAHRPEVIAIGECGLDTLHGGPIDLQSHLFEHHAQLADNTGKPLIIHCVKSFPAIIALKRQLKPTSPWIIHGFRGKPQLAQELLSHGFFISLGEKFNPDSLSVIPPDRLLAETDESTLSPQEIHSRLGITKSLPLFNH